MFRGERTDGRRNVTEKLCIRPRHRGEGPEGIRKRKPTSSKQPINSAVIGEVSSDEAPDSFLSRYGPVDEGDVNLRALAGYCHATTVPWPLLGTLPRVEKTPLTLCTKAMETSDNQS